MSRMQDALSINLPPEEFDHNHSRPHHLASQVSALPKELVADDARGWSPPEGQSHLTLVRPTPQESEECLIVRRTLTAYLRGQQPGRLQDTSELERHLAGSWAAFEGNDAEGMAHWKLLGRMEGVEWSPPVLSFVIERHGRTCAGSTRADLHR